MWPWSVVFVVFQHQVAAFCTAYAPLVGSRFQFPARTCLTSEFLASEHESFGREPIRLANELRNLSYKGLEFPLALEASWGWESGHTVTAVVDILLRELLGVNTEFVCTWGSLHAMRLLGGCANPMGTDPCTSAGIRQQDPPLAHVSVESWVTTEQENLEMNKHNMNLGMLGYYSKSGLWFDEKIAQEAYLADGLSLEWWQSVAEHPKAASYFDTPTVIAQDISEWSNGTVGPLCKSGSQAQIDLEALNLTCTDGWFFAPSCAHNPDLCIPVVLAEYDWNGLVWMEAAIRHRYPFAITWIGARYSFSYSVRSKKRLMFYCATTNAICHEKPLVKMFADEQMPAGRPDLITSLLKVVWKPLKEIHPQVHQFLSQLNIRTDDVRAMMQEYSKKMGVDVDEDKLVPQIACDWIQNKIKVMERGRFSGANTRKWARWIPRTCLPGKYYDKAAAHCLSCAPGEQSPEGRKCMKCIPGTFAANASTATCSLCDFGMWRTDSESATSCSACPGGTQRSANDARCKPCNRGFFTAMDRQELCQPCAKGQWSNQEGSTICSHCPGSMKTMNRGAVGPQHCACEMDWFLNCTGTPCFVDSNSSGACERCPQGFHCSGWVKGDTHAQPVVLSHHYATHNQPHTAYKCVHARDQCLGGAVDMCGGGRRGLQCAKCKYGQAAVKGGSCEDCSSLMICFAPVALAFGFVGLVVSYRMNSGIQDRSPSKTAMLGTLGLLVVHSQIFSITVSSDANWSSSFKDFYGVLDVLIFNMEMLKVTCHTGHEHFSARYLPGLLVPVTLTCMMMMLWLSSRLVSGFTDRIEAMKLDQVVNTLGAIVLALYVGICKAVFDIFECRPNPGGRSTLKNHDGFLCDSEDVRSNIPAAICAIAVYIVAFIAVYVYIIIAAPNKFANNSGFRIRTHFLLKRWHPEWFHWGVFFLLRNVLCSLAPTMTTDGTTQLLLMILFVFPFFVIQARVGPWRDSISNQHDTIMTSALLLTLIMGVALNVKEKDEAVVNVLNFATMAGFASAFAITGLVLAHFVLSGAMAQVQKTKPNQAQTTALPTLIGRTGSNGYGLKLVRSASNLDRIGSKRSSTQPCDVDAVVGALQSLISNQINSNIQLTQEVLSKLCAELPLGDLEKLSWGVNLLGYHILEDETRRPRGVSLAPAFRRSGMECSPRSQHPNATPQVPTPQKMHEQPTTSAEVDACLSAVVSNSRETSLVSV